VMRIEHAIVTHRNRIKDASEARSFLPSPQHLSCMSPSSPLFSGISSVLNRCRQGGASKYPFRDSGNSGLNPPAVYLQLLAFPADRWLALQHLLRHGPALGGAVSADTT
jgi:hypothetical protein